MKTKEFDTIAIMKPDGLRRIHEELRGLSKEARRASWEPADRELQDWVVPLRREAARSSNTNAES